MPRFMIERNIPGAGAMSTEDLSAASAKSCSVLRDMTGGISWVQSYVTDDRIVCVYDATSKAEILEHAEKSGFPADSVTEVKRVIDPTWGS